MKLSTPTLNLLLFIIDRYGNEHLSEKLNIFLPNFEALNLRAINQKKESRKRIYFKEDGTFHCKNTKLEKLGNAEVWKFGEGVAIHKPLNILGKILQFIYESLEIIINPIKDFVHKTVNNVTNTLPQPVIRVITWLYVFLIPMIGIVFSISYSIFSIFLFFASLQILHPIIIFQKITKKLINLFFAILFQLIIIITSPFFIVLFISFVEMFSDRLWLKRMILGILRSKFADENLITIHQRDIVNIKHVEIKRWFGMKWHGVLITEGDTKRYSSFESFVAMIIPEYWRGTTHVLKVKNTEEAASLIAFLQGT